MSVHLPYNVLYNVNPDIDVTIHMMHVAMKSKTYFDASLLRDGDVYLALGLFAVITVTVHNHNLDFLMMTIH